MPQDTIESSDIIILSMDICWSFVVIFGVCEFGERLCGTFNGINYVYDEISWYFFPCKAQKMLPILMNVAQSPVELHVFGSISCGRITLKSVSRTIIFFYKKKIKIKLHPINL